MAKSKASRPRHASAKGHHKSHNPHKKHRARNPKFLGTNVSTMKMVELVAGGAIGMGLNSVALTYMPDTITSSTPMAMAASAAIAVGLGWAVGMWDKEVGTAFAFGGLMNTVKIGVNAFIPQVGATVGLSGRRGTGDLVNGQVVPGALLTPGITLSTGGPMGGGVTSAYPAPYAIAA